MEEIKKRKGIMYVRLETGEEVEVPMDSMRPVDEMGSLSWVFTVWAGVRECFSIGIHRTAEFARWG